MFFWFFFMLVGTGVQYMFYRNLKNHHPSIWIDAGSPTIWSDRSFLTAWSTIKYIRNRLYHDIEDINGVIYCDSKRSEIQFWFWGSATSAAVFAAFLFTIGLPDDWQVIKLITSQGSAAIR